MNITTGFIQRPQRVVVYGPEGIGKSTFASRFPDPLFLDIEDGTGQLDIKRVTGISSWSMLLSLVQQVGQEKPCKTLVIDTADWAERLCIQHVCAAGRKENIEDFGYGSGYVKLLQEFTHLLEALTELTQAGINTVLLAHAQIRKFEQPDEMGAYDRWELKLNKKTTAQTAAVVKEWADALLFANYKTMVVDDGNGRKKGVGGKRVMYTQHAPTWDAKNRWGLPMEVPFDFASIASYIPGSAAFVPTGEIPLKPEKPAPAPKPESAKPESTGTLGKVRALLEAEGVSEEDVRKAVAARKYYPIEVPISDYAPEFLEGCVLGAWPQLKAFIQANQSKSK